MSGKKRVYRRSVDKSRRSFYRKFLAETLSLFEEIHGKPQMRVKQIDTVSDDVARRMIPVFNNNQLYRVENNYIFLRDYKTGVHRKIIQLKPREIFIIENFDGYMTIENIAGLVESEFKIEYEEAFQQVKETFFMLAKRMICHPAHAHD